MKFKDLKNLSPDELLLEVEKLDRKLGLTLLNVGLYCMSSVVIIVIGKLLYDLHFYNPSSAEILSSIFLILINGFWAYKYYRLKIENSKL